MTSYHQHFPKASHSKRQDFPDFDNYLQYFRPSRYGTMDKDPDVTNLATSSADTAGAVTTTTTTTTANMNGDMYSNGMDLKSVSSYTDYPNRKPFVNSEYARDSNKPVNSYPTSDRDAVLSALRNLQDKVKKLELERMAAEHNLEALATHTEEYKELVNSDRYSSSAKNKTKTVVEDAPSKPAAPSSLLVGHQYSSLRNGRAYVNTQAKELDGQLTSAENRCQMLEKQLDYMKKLVETSERDRRQLVEKTLKARQEPSDVRLHLNRLNELERDQLRLNATQNLTEAKLRDLEDRVGEEKIFRRKLQGQTAELESACKDKNQKQLSPKPRSASPPPSPVSMKPAEPTTLTKARKPPKKKKKKTPPQTQRSSTSNRTEPMRHYRLNLAEIPFVAGKSTTPSHALGANVQKVLAMMKSHNAALCSQGHGPGSDSQRSESPISSGSGSSVSVDQDLTELLNQLQEEFQQLSSDHQELVQRLNGTFDKGERLDLEQETEVIVSRMEAKAQQLAKIRQHQNKYEDSNKKHKSSKTSKSKRPHSAGGRLTTSGNHHQHHHHHHHQHNHHPKPHSQQNGSTPRPQNQSGKSTGNSALGKPALYMLRDMKKLQTTLRRDDLCWN